MTLHSVPLDIEGAARSLPRLAEAVASERRALARREAAQEALKRAEEAVQGSADEIASLVAELLAAL